ncbi:hypothetical protein [Paenibacillus sp. N3.4]|uniref:hypothetical protein n=1 Tax=Paenibacillus sp. N3.4 TaxID=2603222 RepID=UPI0011CC2B25|nr:hypothetical protein [Paenibacillus sp. N3.4]TXK72431.1 hypothetical protein FU659_31175 [Paenibacillus sp. N3.4]
MSACKEQRKAEIPSPFVSSLPVNTQEPVDQPAPPETEEAAPKQSALPKDWEQVSRLQRVIGVITDLQISDDQVQFIDLMVKQNVSPVNNPVAYDYKGQTLHLIIDEPLSAAGVLQDKVNKGSAFLVNFAQFAIPPKGEVVLASRFSYNNFFYEQKDSFMDRNGQPFDLKAEFEAARPTTVPTPKPERKILYALEKKQLIKPLTQIPYYRQEKFETLPKIVFEQYNEGHQPWLSNPVTVALVNCSNLMSSDDVDVLQNIATTSEKKIVIDSDRSISEVSTGDSDFKVVMTKPGGISYDITLFAPAGTDILFVKEIVENTPSK